MGVAMWQCGQTNWLMFSTMPSTGMCTLSNICLARTTSASATSCGVVTSTAPAARMLLRDGERHVAGARRQVDHQVVELAPVHVAQQLLERAVQHRPAPDERLVRLDQEADATSP